MKYKVMIKVLQILNSLGRGGIECLVRDICKNIDRSKIEIDVAIMEGKPLDQFETFRSMGITIHQYPVLTPRTVILFTNWWKKFFQNHKGSYNIVHVHTYGTAALYVRYAKKSGAYVIVHSHNVASKGSTIKVRANWIRKILLCKIKNSGNVDLRMACSKDAGKDVWGTNTFFVLKNGIEIEKFRYDAISREHFRNQFGWEESVVIGHVGNGTGAKNQEFLLEIFNDLYKNHPEYRLVLVGKLNRIERTLNKYIKEHGLEQVVSIIGVRDDIPKLMSAMDMFVFPSIYEGLGIVLIEAQTEGLICVVSGAIPQEANVADYYTVMPTGSTESAWSKEIIKMWNIYKDADRENAWKHTQASGYEIKDVAQEMQQIYLEKTFENLKNATSCKKC